MTAMTREEMVDDYNWQEAFKLIGKPKRCEGTHCSDRAFGIGDVNRVLRAVNGDNDGPSWEAVVELHDGRYAYISAWCDYTGWGCQDGASAWVSNSLENLDQFGVTQDARDRFTEAGQ